MNIGYKTKLLREQKGYSIREFAKLCDLSASLVSQVERDVASPSLASLVKMAEVLGCPVGHFFEQHGEDQIVVRKEERRKLTLPQHKPTYELATPSQLDGELRVLIVTIDSKQYTSEKKVSHQDKEICFVLQGKVEVEFEQQRYELKEGDTIAFESQNPHRFYNPEPNPAKIMLIIYK